MLASGALVAQNIAFGIVALMMVVGAIRVVTTKNVVHAALWLVVVLGGAAAQYLILSAEFVAITQVLVYVGAVTVLFLFGTMLTRAQLGKAIDLNNKNWALGIPVAALLLGTLTYVLIDSFHAEKLVDDPKAVPGVVTQQISDSIFKDSLLPFWALSFVLLAALVGAIVLARRD
jgi:NADH-quinone oxidoreductase subunit J